MRKLFTLGAAIVVSMAMLLTACKKDNIQPTTSDNNNNSETPVDDGDGGEVTPNLEYPETAVVLPQAVTDIDGNTYDAVQIGNQVWMSENLRTTRYADCTTIPIGSTISNIEPYRYVPGPYQSNEENMSFVFHYGYLYNWPAVMHGESSSTGNPSGVQGICPNGWHVPSDAEWTELTNYMTTLSIYMASGNADHLAKALAATWGWNSSSETDAPGNNPSINNVTGFSALPAGYCTTVHGDYGYNANIWSATKYNDYTAYYRRLEYDGAYVFRYYGSHQYTGFSVRCVRD